MDTQPGRSRAAPALQRPRARNPAVRPQACRLRLTSAPQESRLSGLRPLELALVAGAAIVSPHLSA
eukprot:431037-Prymnesium_polylepis.2